MYPLQEVGAKKGVVTIIWWLLDSDSAHWLSGITWIQNLTVVCNVQHTCKIRKSVALHIQVFQYKLVFFKGHLIISFSATSGVSGVDWD